MKLAPLLSAAWLAVAAMPGAAEVFERQQSVRPLPGSLDSVLMVNDNNPELIEDDGILISTFPDGEAASVPVVLNGRFDLFSTTGTDAASPSGKVEIRMPSSSISSGLLSFTINTLSRPPGRGRTLC